SLWFKMQNTEMANHEIFFQKGETVTEGFQIVAFDANTPLFSDSTYGYGLWDDDWNQQVDVVWDNTDWHHLVITVDSNNTVRLYRNGILRNSDENSSIDIGTEPLQNYYIGQGFEGHLDDLRVYKRALSPNEVSELFNLSGDCYQCL
ncbi:MAG TPA: LamG domain-containing protein, partial [Aquaticitalea sp.]|nr:LamG domain-containing protein [Aquaticitalea sp.]